MTKTVRQAICGPGFALCQPKFHFEFCFCVHFSSRSNLRESARGDGSQSLFILTEIFEVDGTAIAQSRAVERHILGVWHDAAVAPLGDPQSVGRQSRLSRQSLVQLLGRIAEGDGGLIGEDLDRLA